MISRFAIAGWGSYRPREIATSVDLDLWHGHRPGWTQREFGIVGRHVASADETTSMIAAAREALDRAGRDVKGSTLSSPKTCEPASMGFSPDNGILKATPLQNLTEYTRLSGMVIHF